MAIDEQTHVALPKLQGAPAYARPPRRVAPSPRPFDPDEFPIEAYQTEDERRLIETLPARAYAPGGGVVLDGTGDRRDENGHAGADGRRGGLRPRPFRLKALAGRRIDGDS